MLSFACGNSVYSKHCFDKRDSHQNFEKPSFCCWSSSAIICLGSTLSRFIIRKSNFIVIEKLDLSNYGAFRTLYIYRDGMKWDAYLLICSFLGTNLRLRFLLKDFPGLDCV